MPASPQATDSPPPAAFSELGARRAPPPRSSATFPARAPGGEVSAQLAGLRPSAPAPALGSRGACGRGPPGRARGRPDRPAAHTSRRARLPGTRPVWATPGGSPSEPEARATAADAALLALRLFTNKHEVSRHREGPGFPQDSSEPPNLRSEPQTAAGCYPASTHPSPKCLDLTISPEAPHPRDVLIR